MNLVMGKPPCNQMNNLWLRIVESENESKIEFVFYWDTYTQNLLYSQRRLHSWISLKYITDGHDDEAHKDWRENLIPGAQALLAIYQHYFSK